MDYQSDYCSFWDEKTGSYGKYGGNIFALKMGVPADRKARVVEALRNDITANQGHLDTGIFGTRFFFEVLSDNGLHELAYGAMTRRSMPMPKALVQTMIGCWLLLNLCADRRFRSFQAS